MVDLSGIALVEEADIQSGIVRGALAYWRGKGAEDRPPPRARLDPAEIPRLLPNLILKEVRRDPWDFRYRLVGTNVREHSRSNWTGKWMSEMPGQDGSSVVYRVARQVAESERPLLYRPPYVGPHREFKFCEACVLPWADEAGTVDRLMIAVDFIASFES
jgi:hypothetical protein